MTNCRQHHHKVVASIDDGNRRLAGRRVGDAALFELIGEHEPEDGVILVVGIAG